MWMVFIVGIRRILLCSVIILYVAPAPLSAWQDQEQKQKNGRPEFTLQQSLGRPNRAHTGDIKNVVVMPNEQALSCGSDGSVCHWDLATGRIVKRLYDGASETIFCLALLGDTHVLAGGDGKKTSLWDVKTGELIRTYDQESTVFAIDICPGENSFVCGDDRGVVTHWSLENGMKLAEYRRNNDDITAVRCVPDGSGFITGNSDGEIAIWKFGAKSHESQLDGLKSWICCLQFSKDFSQLAASDYYGTVGVWDFESKNELWIRKKASNKIYWIRFNNSGDVWGIGGDSDLVEFEEPFGTPNKFKIAKQGFSGFDFSEDQKTVFCGGNNVICGWRLSDFQRVYPNRQDYNDTGSIGDMLLVGNKIITANDRQIIVARDWLTNKVLYEVDLRQHLDIDVSERFVELLPINERQMVASTTDTYLLLDAESGQPIISVEHSLSEIDILPTADKMIALANGGSEVVEIDLPNTVRRKIVEASEAGMFDIQVFNQDYLVAITEEPSIQIRSLVGGHVVRQAELEAGRPNKLVTAQKTIVAVVDDSHLRVFAAPQRKHVKIDKTTFQRLVKELNANDFATRQRATKELANGGPDSLELLSNEKPANAELQFRFEKIRRMISNQAIPDLEPLSGDFRTDQSIDAIAIAPNGEFFLLAVREGWKSKLHVGIVGNNRFQVVDEIELRSRATSLEFAESANRFAIGYADGCWDIFSIKPK